MRIRTAATAALGVGLALLSTAGAAQAATDPLTLTAADDSYTWTRADVQECFYADALANDAALLHGFDAITVVSGAVTARDGRENFGDAEAQIEVCPAAGLKPGDVVQITYAAFAINNEAGGYLHAADGSIGIHAEPATVTITVAGTVGADSLIPSATAPGQSPATGEAAAGADEVTIAAGVPTPFVVSSLPGNAAVGATRFTTVTAPAELAAAVAGDGSITFHPEPTVGVGPFAATYATDAGTTGVLTVTVSGGVTAQSQQPVDAPQVIYTAPPALGSNHPVLSIIGGLLVALAGIAAPFGMGYINRRFFA